MSHFARGAKVREPPKPPSGLTVPECWFVLMEIYQEAGMPTREEFLLGAKTAYDAWHKATFEHSAPLKP